MRRFQLVRDEDVSGSSGTGLVAEGIVFTDGTSVLRWLSENASTAVYTSFDMLVVIHGHEGKTRVRWLD